MRQASSGRRPVLVGYLAGVAVIMIADQLRRVTGVPVTGETFLAQAGSFARGLGQMQPATVAVAACLVGLADALGTEAAALVGASSTGQDLTTAAPVPAGPWIADERTGRPGERPGPSLG